MGSVRKVTPSPIALEGDLCRVFGGAIVTSFCASASQMEFRPLRARKRPIILVADDEFFTRVADIELNARLLVPTVAFAFEEIAEELLLQTDAVVGVVMRPVLDAVHFEPFLLRRRRDKSLRNCRADAAAVRPSSQRKACGTFTLRPIRPHRLVDIVVERMGEIGLAEIVAIGAHLLRGQRLRARHPVAVHAAAVTVGAEPVLHGLDLHVVPVLRKGE